MTGPSKYLQCKPRSPLSLGAERAAAGPTDEVTPSAVPQGLEPPRWAGSPVLSLPRPPHVAPSRAEAGPGGRGAAVMFLPPEAKPTETSSGRCGLSGHLSSKGRNRSTLLPVPGHLPCIMCPSCRRAGARHPETPRPSGYLCAQAGLGQGLAWSPRVGPSWAPAMPSTAGTLPSGREAAQPPSQCICLKTGEESSSICT